MAITPITFTINGNQTLTVNSVLNGQLNGFAVTSSFGGVTIQNNTVDNGPPAEAGWHNGPVWLDMSYRSINQGAVAVLQASGTATTPDGASQIVQFTVLANTWPYSPG